MTNERYKLEIKRFDFALADFENDLGPLDLDLPDLDIPDFDFGDVPNVTFDIDNLNVLLNFDLDGIGADLDAAILPTAINARDGVLDTVLQKCGALTRKGTPCRCKPLPGKKRCKFHGGVSTGPKTLEGRERIAEAQRRRWSKWRAEQTPPN